LNEILIYSILVRNPVRRLSETLENRFR